MAEPYTGGLPPDWLIDAGLLRTLAPRGILFLCVANSARSQMAEGIARRLAPTRTRIYSAGSQPTTLNPLAAEALAEIGIDIRRHKAKPIDDIPVAAVDAVITLCAEEACPFWPAEALRFHWALPDPAAVTGNKATRLQAFRDVRDDLYQRLRIVFGRR